MKLVWMMMKMKKKMMMVTVMMVMVMVMMMMFLLCWCFSLVFLPCCFAPRCAFSSLLLPVFFSAAAFLCWNWCFLSDGVSFFLLVFFKCCVPPVSVSLLMYFLVVLFFAGLFFSPGVSFLSADVDDGWWLMVGWYDVDFDLDLILV